MDRIANCKGCGARLKVPETFKGNAAKCPKCAAVVEIPPAAAAPPTLPPAAPARPAAPPRPAAAARPTAPARPSAPPPPAAEEKGAIRRPSARERIAAREQAGGRASRHGKAGAAARGERGERHRPAPAKPSGNPALVWGSIGLLVVGGGIAAFFLLRSSGEETVVAKAPAEDPIGLGTAPVDAPPTAMEAAPPPPEPEPEAREKKEPAEKPKPIIPDVDLSQEPDLEPDAGASPELLEEIDRLVQTTLDPDAGAAGMRAMGRLTEIGLPAMPAILNAAKRIDYSTQEGNRLGSFVFVALLEKRMTNGKGFGYHSEIDEDSVKRNRLIVRAWMNHVRRQIYGTPDPQAAWAKFTEMSPEGGEDPAATPAAAPKKPKDDLGLGDLPK